MFFGYLSRATSQIPVTLTIAFASLFAQPIPGRGDEPLPKGHYWFTGVKVIAIDRIRVDGKVNDKESDKLTYWIRFDFRPKFKLLKGSEELPFKIVNPTVGAKSRLTLDKPIKFQRKVVPAGTNLLEYKKFDGSHFNVMMPDLSPLAIKSVRIQSGFQIPADTYTVSFEWLTAENEVFSDKVKVHIDVNLQPR